MLVLMSKMKSEICILIRERMMAGYTFIFYVRAKVNDRICLYKKETNIYYQYF